MEPTQELIDSIYRERVLRARRTPIEKKVMAGPELFEQACQRMMAGLRHEQPHADEEQIYELLVKRLDLLKRLRESNDRPRSDFPGYR